MKRILWAAGLSFVLTDGGNAMAQTGGGNDLRFNPDKYVLQTVTVNGQALSVRAYEGIVYVARPVDTVYEEMNIYVPAGYFTGGSVHGYTAATAPIFYPNNVGGYMPARPGKLGGTIAEALARGYVVATAGARGRTTKDANGVYTGKAPADIVDMKAGVRYLKFNDGLMPGDAHKIISNGTSAGGAMSVLLGATGNSSDYEPYLRALGAAAGTDDIFAVSAYCPITNLDNADMAYEWQFNGVNTFEKRGFPGGPGGPGGPPPGGAPGGQMPGGPGGPDGAGGPPPGGGPGGASGGQGSPGGPGGPPPSAGSSAGTELTKAQIAVSGELKTLFPAYVNGLQLKDRAGEPIGLDADGNGSFKELVKQYVMQSAQRAIGEGKDLAKLSWLTIANGKVTGLDFNGYVRYMQRMKTPPAFDGLDLSTGENQLFGNEQTDKQHFTAFGVSHSTIQAGMADPLAVKMMNPMNYIGQASTKVALHWRIRHGSKDKDTGLAIPVILATYLQNKGFDVNLELPWDRPHSGDYDLKELFTWIDGICQ